MPWEKQFDEAQVLDRAMEAFWARGYEATSVNDLVAATGINRGSLYGAFSDKHTLFVRVLERYDQQHRRQFLQDIAEQHGPREAIVAAFRQVAEAALGGRNRNGCLLVNTAMELSPHDPEIERLVRSSLEEVEEFFRSMIDAGKAKGTIPKTVSSTETAQMLLSLFLGLRVITRSRPDKSLMNVIVAQVEANLG